jgi:hypothetical protein
MTREPNPQAGCLPGGSCPECNPAPVYCQTCFRNPTANVDEPCGECEAAMEEEAVEVCSVCLAEGCEDEEHKAWVVADAAMGGELGWIHTQEQAEA